MKKFKNINTLKYLNFENLPTKTTDVILHKIQSDLTLNTELLKKAAELQSIEGDILYVFAGTDENQMELIEAIADKLEDVREWSTSHLNDLREGVVLEEVIREEFKGVLDPGNPLMVFAAHEYDVLSYNLKLLDSEVRRLQKEVNFGLVLLAGQK